jgi:hypothetical protein
MAEIASRPLSASYVDWRAAFAGGTLATAIAFVLLTFGTAVGLSSVSPWRSESGLSVTTVVALGAFWAIMAQIAAVLAGSYIAGRMRERREGAPPDEVEFRDGVHGGLVWAIGVIITAFLAISTAGSTVKTATDVAGRAAAVAANSDPVAYYAGKLLRQPAGRPAADGANTSDLRNDLTGIFNRSIVNGSLAADDRDYLVDTVAQRTGQSREEAAKRIQSAYDEVSRTVKEAADKARRGGVLLGFITAVSLVVSLAAGWWAAIRGGHHRDNAIPARFTFAQRRV